MRRTSAVLAAVAITSGLAAQGLDDKTFAQYRAYILPKKDELQFLAIPWRPTLWMAVLEAQRAEKPILLWAMNGHPLTCT